jgi:hypothetical protein
MIFSIPNCGHSVMMIIQIFSFLLYMQLPSSRTEQRHRHAQDNRQQRCSHRYALAKEVRWAFQNVGNVIRQERPTTDLCWRHSILVDRDAAAIRLQREVSSSIDHAMHVARAVFARRAIKRHGIGGVDSDLEDHILETTVNNHFSPSDTATRKLTASKLVALTGIYPEKNPPGAGSHGFPKMPCATEWFPPNTPPPVPAKWNSRMSPTAAVTSAGENSKGSTLSYTA